MRALRTVLRDDTGQGATEYAVLLGTLAFGAIVMLLAMSARVQSVFNFVSTQLNQTPTN